MSRPENELDIDQAKISAEAEAVPLPDHSMPCIEEGGAGVSTTSEAPAPMPTLPDAWGDLTPVLVLIVDKGLCPNWQLTADEKRDLDAALAASLNKLFPGGMGNERWAPYFRLLAVAAIIAAARFDTDKLRFLPLRKPKPAELEQPAEAAAPAVSSSFVASAGAGQSA